VALARFGEASEPSQAGPGDQRAGRPQDQSRATTPV